MKDSIAPINFSLKDFLYFLIVNEKVFKQLETLDQGNKINISLNFIDNQEQIYEDGIENLRSWSQKIFGNNLESKIHQNEVIRQFKDFKSEIQQQYYPIQQFSLGKQVSHDLSILIPILTEGFRQDDSNIIKDLIKLQVNQILYQSQIKINQFDPDKNIVAIEQFGKVSQCALKVNEAFEKFISDNYEIRVIKPKTRYDQFIEKLSKKYKFVYCEKQEKNSYNDSDESQNEDNEENSSKSENNDNQSTPEDDEDGDENNIILVRNKKNLKQDTKSIDEIAQMIEQENCDRFVQIDSFTKDILEYLISECKFDDFLINEHDIMIEIHSSEVEDEDEKKVIEYSLGIYGCIDAQQRIEQLLNEIKNNKIFLIKYINQSFDQIKQYQKDIEEENKSYREHPPTQITLLEKNFGVWPYIKINCDMESEADGDDIQELVIIYFSQSQQKEISELDNKFFKQNDKVIQVEKDLMPYQIKLLEQTNIRIVNKDDRQICINTNEISYKKYLKNFSEIKLNFIEFFKIDCGRPLYLKLLLQKKKDKLENLKKKYKKFIYEQTEDQWPIWNIYCQQSEKDRLKKRLETYLNEIKQEVEEFSYELNNEDLKLFSKYSNDLLRKFEESKQKQERGEQQQEEEIEIKEIESLKILSEYYLNEICHELSNNLLNEQWDRENEIKNDFTLSLVQKKELKNNQIVKQNTHHVKIQFITTNDQKDTLTYLLGAHNCLILKDHPDQSHQQAIETIEQSQKDQKSFIYKLKNQDNSEQQNFKKIKEFTGQSLNQQEIILAVKEDNQYQIDNQNQNNLILIGEKVLDQVIKMVNQKQIDENQTKFLTSQLTDAILQKDQIVLMIKNKDIRMKIIKIILQIFKSMKSQFTNFKVKQIKVYFHKFNSQLENENNQSSSNNNSTAINKFDQSKNNQEITDLLEIFKNDLNEESNEIYEKRKKIQSQWYYYDENNKIQEFNNNAAHLIKESHIHYLENINNKSDKQEKYLIITPLNNIDVQQNNQNNENQDKKVELPEFNRDVIINFKNKEVFINFLNQKLDFKLFYDLYPEIEQVFSQMKFSNSQDFIIKLTATKQSVNLQSLRKIEFENEIYEINFSNPNSKNHNPYLKQINFKYFQKSQNKQFQINHQQLVFDNSDQDIILLDESHITYNFKKDSSKNQEKFSLKLLIHKEDKSKAKELISKFLKMRHSESNHSLEHHNKKDEDNPNKRLRFKYYKPELRREMKRVINMNFFKLLHEDTTNMEMIIYSSSKQQLLNFEENEIKMLSIYSNKNWKEIGYQMKTILDSQMKNTMNSFFLSQLNNSHKTYLSLLNDWHIDGYKKQFIFQINTQKYINLIEGNEEYEFIYTLPSELNDDKEISVFLRQFECKLPQTILKFNDQQKYQFKNIKELYHNNNKDSEINIIVFLKPQGLNNPLPTDYIPIFYLLFMK